MKAYASILNSASWSRLPAIGFKAQLIRRLSGALSSNKTCLSEIWDNGITGVGLEMFLSGSSYFIRESVVFFIVWEFFFNMDTSRTTLPRKNISNKLLTKYPKINLKVSLLCSEYYPSLQSLWIVWFFSHMTKQAWGIR